MSVLLYPFMKCAKSIDELYEEVSEFDLVITVDAALATALNARIDRPIIGSFALTPRQIASKIASRVMDKAPYNELRVISSVSDETGLSFKYVHSEVENIREIRKYTIDVRKHLHSEASKAVYDSYEKIPTLDRLMGAFIPEDDQFFKGNKIAVIEEDLFNDLDKHFNPIGHESISIFKKGDYEIPRIYEIGNDRQLAENAVDMISVDNCTDFAIVLNTSSPIADAVRTALYRKRIPFINSLTVRDLSQIRDYLQFITLALDFDTIRVKHVKELFSNYNGFFRKGREEFLLSKQTENDMPDRCMELWNVMKDIRKMTFGEVCDAICDRNARIQVGMTIDDLKVRDQVITRYLLGEVKYAVDNVNELRHSEEIPDDERNGVLLVDCNNSVYIDRPVVIYLGLEQDWNMPVVGKPYLDAEEETDKNVMRLTALLQQGSVRYYFVNSTKGGKPAKPNTLFSQIYHRPIKSFRDICDDIVKGRWHEESGPISVEKESITELDPKAFTRPFSKSSFDAYYSCPRKYLYSSLLNTPDEKSTELGNLVHAFAEFYVCYPEIVEEKGIDHFVDLVSERYSGLSSPLLETLDRDHIRCAMISTVEYLKAIGVHDVPLDKPISKNNPNQFFVAFGKTMGSSVCENDIYSKTYPIHGKMDLYWNGVITDYKTGKPSSASSIAEAMTFDSNAQYPEFQPPIYLQIISELGGSRNRFNQFYAMDNDVPTEEGKAPVMSNVRVMQLDDRDLKGCLNDNPALISSLETDLSKNLREHAAEIVQIIHDIGQDDPSTWDKDGALKVAVLSCAGLNDNATNRKTVEAGLRKIAGYLRYDLVTAGAVITVPKTTMEQTMSRITEAYEEMVSRRTTDYPPEPRGDCKRCRFLSVCTRDQLNLGGQTDE
ncbi:PD-(D/E)XK nuclease superfamily protein [methanogenic archaeon mixed culture ISO4-G1]|nr:PD-(D/E)XK nuclease superfamily protein [methanogenic archaeon mixed culture ISO4-G1]